MNKSLYLTSLLLLFVTTITLAQKPATQETEIPTTTIEFQSEVFNWGELEEGELVENVFSFTNTGTEPLIISNAKGSCGCTVPRWPKEPIMPGESADLLVRFNSKNKGKVGGRLQSKRVTITANTDPKNTYLTIKGMVFKPEEEKEVTKVEPRRDTDIEASSVNVFPNPSAGMINLDLKDHVGQAARIEVYAMQGSRVMVKNIDQISNDVITLNIPDYIPGIYTVSVKLDGKHRIAKQVILE